jgi:hypothetical protein
VSDPSAGCAGRLRDPFLPYEVETTCAVYELDTLPSRGEMHSFYQQSPLTYWVHHGMPPLVRRMGFLLDYGEPPSAAQDAVFGFLQPLLDMPSLQSYLQSGPPEAPFFADLLGPPPAPPLLFFHRVIAFIVNAVHMFDTQNVPAHLDSYRLLITHSFPSLLEQAPPAPSKDCANDESTLLAVVDGTIGRLERPPRPDDNNPDPAKRFKWTNITGVMWDTTYNPSCVGQAYGPCLRKLGAAGLRDDVDCPGWNDFGRTIGSVPGQPGATPRNIEASMRALGFACSTAYDGLFESACEEIKKALARGCDATFYWPVHVEMILDVHIDPNDSTKCTVVTSSWGRRATVVYKDGKASDKSDRNRYGDADRTFPNGARARMVYYCKK